MGGRGKWASKNPLRESAQPRPCAGRGVCGLGLTTKSGLGDRVRRLVRKTGNMPFYT